MSYSGVERGKVVGGAASPAQATLNVRLNGALDRLISLSRNLNRVIDNVEGRPTQVQDGTIMKVPNENRPMLNAIEALEGEVERLNEITRHLEQIA